MPHMETNAEAPLPLEIVHQAAEGSCGCCYIIYTQITFALLLTGLLLFTKIKNQVLIYSQGSSNSVNGIMGPNPIHRSSASWL